MIKITPTWLEHSSFIAWKKKAESARDRMLSDYKATGKVPKLNDAIWKNYKKLLWEVLEVPKCAYCEVRLQYPAHADHYRPKAAVSENRTSIDHTGYFWLAYEWDNLVLCCHSCNSAHTEAGDKSSHPGKANESRIKGNRISAPASDPTVWDSDLQQEDPLVLNPYTDSPEDHIAFVTNEKCGVPVAKDKSEKGKETIAVCHLDRLSLCEKRFEVADGLFKSRLHRIAQDKTAPWYEEGDEFSLWLRYFFAENLLPMAKRAGLKVVEWPKTGSGKDSE